MISKLEVVTDAVPAALVYIDAEERFVFCNAYYESNYGRPRAQILGKTVRETVGEEHYARLKPHIQKVLSGRPVSFEIELQRTDRSPILAEVTYIPDFGEDGKVRGFAAISQDITERKLLESRLRTSVEQFKLLGDTMPQLVWITNMNGDVEHINRRWFEFTGIEADNFDRELWLKTIHPDDRESVLRAHTEALQRRKEFAAEYRLRRHDGQYRWHLARTVVVEDEGGRPAWRFGTATDIHDQKMAMQAMEVIHRVGQSLVAELDMDRLVQLLTDAATQLSGAEFGAFFYNVINAQGESLTLYSLSGAKREAFARFPTPRNTLVFAPTFSGKEPVVRSDDILRDPRYGKNAPFNGMPEGHLPVRSYMAVSVISRSGEVLGGLFFGHRDPGMFTQQHERIVSGLAAQAAVALDNARLYQQLRESVATRDEFLSIASHELKTPLTSLKLQAQMRARALERGDLEAFKPERLRQSLDNDIRQIERLSRLIEDMLDISRLDSRKLALQRERCDLQQIVHDTIERNRTLSTAAGCEIQLIAAEQVMGLWDSFRMEQALTNLLTNAIRYGRKRSIRVTLSSLNGKAYLSVQDQGIGIARENRERIFQRFERAVSANEISGLGLGLYITRQIVEMHGGRVTVDSEIDVGSTFTIELPL